VISESYPELASRAENGFLEAFDKLGTMFVIELSNDSGV